MDEHVAGDQQQQAQAHADHAGAQTDDEGLGVEHLLSLIHISEVFNAETFIIGLCSGVMGVVLSEILLIPGNMLIQKISNGTNVVARLPLNAALVLIVLATVLTILGGFIPAKGASRSDPVKALRSE